MKKTGLVILIFFISQTVFASFPKNTITDSVLTLLPAIQPIISSSNKSDNKEYKDLTYSQLSFVQKLELKLLRHCLAKRNFRSGKANWIASIGGFLLGLASGPIGFGISRFTKNEALRDGASLGFKVFLALIAVYLALVLAVLLLLALAAPK